MNDLNTNNSKKLITGISIVFCTIILIIGATSAYFTEGDTKEIGNIVSTDQVSLLFDDNDDYMLGNLIPVSEEDVLKFASKDTDICKYQEGMYACNLYEFTITNNSNVAQELMITLKPTFNEFGNLHYILLDKNKDDISLDNVPVSNGHINETNSIEIANKIVLGAGSSKTYTIVYYVKNLEDIDQTSMDAGKQFYAKVRVDSITTGTYAETLMEAENCYNYELINDTPENRELYGDLFTSIVGTYKLTEFYGIDEFGVADSSCGVTRNGDFYSVTVPSKIKDEEGNELEISTLGNQLFVGIDMSTGNLTYKSKINHISIDEGIKIIDDGSASAAGTFAAIGIDETFNLLENFEFTIELPDTLIHLGSYAFFKNQIYALNIPTSVKIIANELLGPSEDIKVLSTLTFDNNSQLTTIGDSAFTKCKIESLLIPASVQKIESYAFAHINTLTSLTFSGANNNTSNLNTIGENAFYNTNLNYVDDSLVLPDKLETIGDSAFMGVTNFNTQLNNILFMGTRENLDKLGTGWYNSNITTVKAYGEE